MKTKIIGVILIAIVLIVIVLSVKNLKEKETGAGLSNTVPMYGTKDYGDYLAKQSKENLQNDNILIAQVTKEKTKEEASQEAVRLGWKYFFDDDYDTAMKRFNQAWLLDQSNYNVYWGYGEVLRKKTDFENSVIYFDKALAMYDENKARFKNDYLSLWGDASVAYISLSDTYLATDEAKSKLYSAKAIPLLTNAIKEKENISKEILSMLMLGLSIAYFNNGAYAESRTALNEMKKNYSSVEINSIAIDFEKTLKEKGY